jgi:hypothetical protein
VLIYTAIEGKTLNASHQYRQLTPLRAVERLDPDNIQLAIDMLDAGTSQEIRLAAMSYADLCVLYQPLGRMYVDFIAMSRKWKAKKSKATGRLQYPPAWVCDSDDNILDVPPTNFTYRTLGIRRPDGTDLKPGDIVRVQRMDGTDTILWEDGRDGFDIATNHLRLATFRDIMGSADLVTCSTTEVERYIKEGTAQKNTFIMPNCVDPDDYPEVELREHPGEVRVLWQGSPTHSDDWYFMVDPLAKAAKAFPEVKWILWGAAYDKVADVLPTDRLKIMGWKHHMAYRPLLATVGHDISLAPLRPDRFNACRSPIKWYESSIIHRPAATLAQDGVVYGSEIQDGVTGMLWKDGDEFVEKLGILVQNEKTRQEMAQNAKQWVLENRHVDVWAPRLYEKYQEVIAARRKTVKIGRGPLEKKRVPAVKSHARRRGAGGGTRRRAKGR